MSGSQTQGEGQTQADADTGTATSSEKEGTLPNVLGMSDDDFLKHSSPEALIQATTGEASASGEEEEDDNSSEQDAGTSTEGQKKPQAGEGEGKGKPDNSDGSDRSGTGTKEDTTGRPKPGAKPGEEGSGRPAGKAPGSGEGSPETQGAKATGTRPDTKSKEGTDGKPAGGASPTQTSQTSTQAPTQVTPEQAQSFYHQVMTPFKANGKTISLKSPDEVIQLMQMGANYTRKMQELVPHRKTLTMLENNGLLGNESELSFLLDLRNRNPEAIKKLIKDSGIDPLDIDTKTDSNYRAGNHAVTDEEVGFKTTLADLKSTEGGLETLKTIHADWDQASKEELWKSPEVMTIIHTQRENGIYDRITAEMNRQRTLGKIAPTVPFLLAYKQVGDQLVEANGFDDLIPSRSAASSGNGKGNGSAKPGAGAPVTTRAAAPRPQVATGSSTKAAAAASTRTSPAPAKGVVNPLSMPDDEFLKQMNGRL